LEGKGHLERSSRAKKEENPRQQRTTEEFKRKKGKKKGKARGKKKKPDRRYCAKHLGKNLCKK